MACQLFSAKLHEDNVDSHFMSLNPPSLSLNNGNEASYQLIATNPKIELHQNDNISLQSQLPTPIFSQLGLNYRMTAEMIRTTIYSQNRVRVHKVIDYVPLEIPPTLCLSNINGAHIIRTQFIPNNTVHFQNQPIYGNMNRTIVNQMLSPFVRSELFWQTPSSNQPTVLIQNNPNDFEFKGNGVFACPPISVRFPVGPDDQDSNSHNQLALTLGKFNSVAESKSNIVGAHTLINQGVHDYKPKVDGQNQEVTYGTRSLPYKKYGPYTCPRCKGKFKTSQYFASHMGSHYRTESGIERKRRQALKFKKKNLHLVQSRHGLTLLPAESFEMMESDHSKKGGKVKVDVKTNVKLQGKGFVGMGMEKEDPNVGVVIKKESM